MTTAVGQSAPPLILLSRPDCGLCADMLRELEALRARHPLPPVQVMDVDSDPVWQRRYGMKIPVLLYDLVPVCSVRLDGAELLRVLRDRRGRA